eukprot:394157-Prymnesium_polylepis.2
MPTALRTQRFNVQPPIVHGHPSMVAQMSALRAIPKACTQVARRPQVVQATRTCCRRSGRLRLAARVLGSLNCAVARRANPRRVNHVVHEGGTEQWS